MIQTPQQIAKTNPNDVYPYLTPEGELAFFVARYDKGPKKKDLIPFRPSEIEGIYIKKMIEGPRPIFNIHLWTKDPKPLVIVEGEKAANALNQKSKKYLAVTWAGGAQAIFKTDWRPLTDISEIILWPDADEAGQRAMQELAEVLRSQNCGVKIISTHELPDGFDAADFDGNDIDAFLESRLIQTPEVIEGDILEFPNLETGFFEPHETEKGQKWIPRPYELADYLKAQYQFTATEGFSLIWDKTHYRIIEPLEVKRLIIELTQRRSTSRHVNEFVALSQAVNQRRTEDMNPPEGFLNLQNGILNLETRELIPHNPKFYFRYCLPHSYDRHAEPLHWVKFLYDVFEGNHDLVDLTAEVFGYALQGGAPWLHKAFLLIGSGRNGKSTYLDVLKHILGPKNVSNVPLQNLSKPFSVVMADGKLANVCGEITTKEIESEAFKLAVGGEELVAAQKGQPEYPMRFQARMFFACNRSPYMRDSSAGVFEKLCFIPFTHYFRPEDRIPNFAERFLFPEASGIINFALDGLERLKARGRLPDAQKTDEMLESYRVESNPVYAFFKECIVISSRFQTEVRSRDIFTHFQTWCENAGIENHRSRVGFGREFSEILRQHNQSEISSSSSSIVTLEKDRFGTVYKGIRYAKNQSEYNALLEIIQV